MLFTINGYKQMWIEMADDLSDFDLITLVSTRENIDRYQIAVDRSIKAIYINYNFINMRPNYIPEEIEEISFDD